MTEPTAADAMAHAEAAHIKVEAHEDLCAERYGHIQSLIGNVEAQVRTILKIIGWGGALFATALLTLLGFFASRALSTNDTQVATLKAQIELLQAQTQGVQGVQGVQGIQGVQGARGDQAK